MTGAGYHKSKQYTYHRLLSVASLSSKLQYSSTLTVCFKVPPSLPYPALPCPAQGTPWGDVQFTTYIAFHQRHVRTWTSRKQSLPRLRENKTTNRVWKLKNVVCVCTLVTCCRSVQLREWWSLGTCHIPPSSHTSISKSFMTQLYTHCYRSVHHVISR